MFIIFSNNEKIKINLNDNDISKYFLKVYKHLQHLNLPFFPEYDNPFISSDIENLTEKLINYGKKLNLDIEKNLCLQKNQDYLNLLHKIYEKNYDGNSLWLKFHELIHLCEGEKVYNILEINYRELAGPLEKNLLNYNFILDSEVFKGEIYTGWSELAKKPYRYWYDGEDDNLERLCELAKPWIKLRPKIMVALEDIDFLKNKDLYNGFDQWWEKYESIWCKHYGLSSYGFKDMNSIIKIGNIDNVNRCIELLKKQIHPIGIKLS